MKKFLEDFNHSLSCFEYPEKGFNEAFSKLIILWYLKLFRRQIKEICINHLSLLMRTIYGPQILFYTERKNHREIFDA